MESEILPFESAFMISHYMPIQTLTRPVSFGQNYGVKQSGQEYWMPRFGGVLEMSSSSSFMIRFPCYAQVGRFPPIKLTQRTPPNAHSSSVQESLVFFKTLRL